MPDDTVRMVKVDGPWRVLPDPGSFYWDTSGGLLHLVFVCPNRCEHRLPIVPTPGGWKPYGNDAEPNLSPAIFDLFECGWEGFIKKGEIITW